MQLDMHYYGTYAMARAAGLNQETSKTIATCAQFVDDNAANKSVEFRDGSRIDVEATAHHPIDLSNLEPDDQRRVWVPFHFLPGNLGSSYRDRMKCRMDSKVAQDMCEHHLGLANRPFAPALIGIAAHVYADTFSHYGFSGISSRGNRVDNNSFRFHEDVEGEDTEDIDPDIRNYITKKAEAFFGKPSDYSGHILSNFNTWLAEEASGALGHGGVATYPDKPFLVWSFDYEEPDSEIKTGKTSVRNNPETFLMGCRALHDLFRCFAKTRKTDCSANDARDFDEISEHVSAILKHQDKKHGRVSAWKKTAEAGKLFGPRNHGEAIPDYEGASWNDEWDALNGKNSYHAAFDTQIWRFYQAAALHRTYVIRDLLPQYELIID